MNSTNSIIRWLAQGAGKMGLSLCLLMMLGFSVFAQGTRLLRQPALSSTHIAFTYGGGCSHTA
jgi:hypothetical protein